MTPEERAMLIAQYIDGYEDVADALENISAEEMDFRTGDDRWTAREIVHHLADSESASAFRLCRLIVEEHPYAAHAHNHANQIRQNRAAFKKSHT
jgi:hypothetical protein